MTDEVALSEDGKLRQGILEEIEWWSEGRDDEWNIICGLLTRSTATPSWPYSFTPDKRAALALVTQCEDLNKLKEISFYTKRKACACIVL